jgi:hypothetical protein
MVNKAKVVQQTKEQIEYEEARKNFRLATAKARLHSGGVDPSKVPQQAIDKVMRIFDDMDHVQQDTQQRTSRVQQEAEAKVQKLNQDANQKFGEIQKKYQDLINSLKEVTVSVSDSQEQVQDDVQSDVQSSAGVTTEIQAEPAKEEVREKTHEEKVAEIADILLHAMRGQIVEKVNEIMCTLDKKASDIIVKEPDDEQRSAPVEEPVKAVTIEEPVEIVTMDESVKTVPEEEIRQAVYKDIV